jgi:hypothetical protein
VAGLSHDNLLHLIGCKQIKSPLSRPFHIAMKANLIHSFLSAKASSQVVPRSKAFCGKEEKLVSIHCRRLEGDEDCLILWFQLSSGLLGWSKSVKHRMTKQKHRTKAMTCGHTELNQTDQELGQHLTTTQDSGINAASSLPLNPPYLWRFS